MGEIAMTNFDKIVSPLFQCYLSRFEDDEKIERFVSDLLPKFEQMATEAGPNKWLWRGSREITYFDFYVGSVWEFLYCFKDAPAVADGFAKINLKKELRTLWHMLNASENTGQSNHTETTLLQHMHRLNECAPGP